MNLILGMNQKKIIENENENNKKELMASIEKNAKHHYARWNKEETIPTKKEAQLIFRRQKIINMSTLWRGWMFISLHFSFVFSVFFSLNINNLPKK